MAAQHTTPKQAFTFGVALAAAAAPSLLAYNVAPSATFFNQALAVGLWGLFAALCFPVRWRASVWPAVLPLALLGLAVLWSWGWFGLPSGMALSALAMLLACAVLTVAGAAAGHSQADHPAHITAHSRAPQRPHGAVTAFFWAWLWAGVANLLVGGLQVFAPAWADGTWLAVPNAPGRAVGNLRQPNHLASLLLWSCVAAVCLAQLGRLRARWAAGLLTALVAGVALTASRTGLVNVVLLALWGLMDTRLHQPLRRLLMAAPAAYAVAWVLMLVWAQATQSIFGGAQRLAQSDISSSRFALWGNTWQLIQAQPWAGVGFGNFNLAWTLTPQPGRPVEFFDHAHNLPLHLAAELGLPLALLVTGVLLWGLLRAAQRAWPRGGQVGGVGQTQSNTQEPVVQRCAWVMVAMIGVHSLLEYPLWYAYFLLPAGFALGLALGDMGDMGDSALQARGATPDRRQTPATPKRRASDKAQDRRGETGLALNGAARLQPLAWAVAAVAVSAGAAYAVLDYGRVARVFSAAARAQPLAQRIAAGQRSVFFGHHADYAAVTADSNPPASAARTFERASHHLLDTRLMTAWAQHLADQGELDRARHLAARLREFRKPESDDFFEACPTQAMAELRAEAGPVPFQCEAPQRGLSWRDFGRAAP